jgi:ADP-ribosylglycohydrolase
MELQLKFVRERVRQEIEAKSLQGYETQGLLYEWKECQEDRNALMALHQKLKTLSLKPGWTYVEPSDLVGIQQNRPSSVLLPSLYLAEDEVYNKIHGGWLGRVAACILGKPLEFGTNTQEVIQAYLEGANSYPLQDYIPAQSRYGTVLRRDCVPSMRGYIRFAQEDDDLNYMCLAVKMLERYGADFSSLAVGVNWLRSMPYLWNWGPEHVIYLNLATAVGDSGYEYEETLPDDIDLEALTGYLNPGTEWIGAQIRTDVYGYVCPNNPVKAAELAWRDAYLTHRMSGIYGAMWVAAMNAAAFTLLDLEAVIRAGLAQIPQKSRFSEAILKTMEWSCSDGDWRETGHRIVEHFGCNTWPGAINNACCVTAALLFGWADGTSSPAEIYERTITIAVQLGYDTDCNAATAGSIVGIMLGANALPEKWVSPINNTLRTCVAGFGEVRISDMARRTYELSCLLRDSSKQIIYPLTIK